MNTNTVYIPYTRPANSLHPSMFLDEVVFGWNLQSGEYLGKCRTSGVIDSLFGSWKLCAIKPETMHQDVISGVAQWFRVD